MTRKLHRDRLQRDSEARMLALRGMAVIGVLLTAGCPEVLTGTSSSSKSTITAPADQTVECDGSGNQAALTAWLSAISARYPEIEVIEVANEAFAPSIRSGFWIGTEDELMQMADWVLDWRKSSGWRGKIWSPAIITPL